MLSVSVGLQKAMDTVSTQNLAVEVSRVLGRLPPGVVTDGFDVISEAISASLEPATLWQIKGPSVQDSYRWIRAVLRTMFSGPMGPDVRCYFLKDPLDGFPQNTADCHWLSHADIIIHTVKNDIKKRQEPFEFIDYVHGNYEGHNVLIKRFKNCPSDVIEHEAYIRGVLNGCGVTPTLVGLLPASDVTFGAHALVLRCPRDAVPFTKYLTLNLKMARTHAIPFCWSAVHAVYMAHQNDVVLNDLDVSHLAVITKRHGSVCDITPKVLLMDLSAASVSKGHTFHKASRWAAPEVRSGGAATRASDIYNLGSVLKQVSQVCGVQVLSYATEWCQRADPKMRPTAHALLGYLVTLNELVERLKRHTKGAEVIKPPQAGDGCGTNAATPRRPPRIMLRYFAECTGVEASPSSSSTKGRMTI